MTQRKSSDHWLFLHGTPLTPEVWRPIADRFDNSTTTVACPSLNSRGTSREHAERILAGMQPNARLHVVGHSFGGQVAIDLALAMAGDSRLASLGLICTRPSPYPAFATAAQALREGKAPTPRSVTERWFTPQELETGSPVVDYARRCLGDADRLVWADALDSIARYDRRSELPSITAPTLVIAAQLDSVSPPEEMAKMAASLPRSRFEVMLGTNHLGPFLRPDALIRALRSASTTLSPPTESASVEARKNFSKPGRP
jgi:pimeloyl-ACP methyl ester carboxylesterase